MLASCRVAPKVAPVKHGNMQWFMGAGVFHNLYEVKK